MSRRAHSTVVPFRRPRRRRKLPAKLWLPWREVGLLAMVAIGVAGGRAWTALAPEAGSGSGACIIGRVIDGDTVKVRCPGQGTFSARLLGFDTPEIFSPGCLSELARGTRATWALRLRIWQAEDVRMVFGGRDRYDRRLMRLYLDGTDVARPMIEGGLARPYHGGRRGSWCG